MGDTDRFNFPTMARTARTSLTLSLVYGLTQDLLALAQGRRVRYVDMLRGKHNE